MRLIISVVILLSTIMADTALACYNIVDSDIEKIEMQNESEQESKEESEQESEEQLITSKAFDNSYHKTDYNQNIKLNWQGADLDNFISDIPYPPPE